MPVGRSTASPEGRRLQGLKLHRDAGFGEVSSATRPPFYPENARFLASGTGLAINKLHLGVAAESAVAARKHGGARNFGDRVSDRLSAAQIANLIAAAGHAQTIGRPFTHMTTIHWEAAGIRPNGVTKATGRYLDLLSKALTRLGGSTSWIWVQENGPGKGAHVHILVHIPGSLSNRVMRKQIGWLKRITDTTYRKRVIKTVALGRRLGLETSNPPLFAANAEATLAYVLKGASDEAAKAFGLVKLDGGGRVVGKRCGVSQNIGAKARAVATRSP